MIPDTETSIGTTEFGSETGREKGEDESASDLEAEYDEGGSENDAGNVVEVEKAVALTTEGT